MKTVAVIGRGINGLSAAYHLEKLMRKQGPDVRIVLIEGNDRLGGKMNTYREGPFIMETGADSMVTRKPNVTPLIHELDMDDEDSGKSLPLNLIAHRNSCARSAARAMVRGRNGTVIFSFLKSI